MIEGRRSQLLHVVEVVETSLCETAVGQKQAEPLFGDGPHGRQHACRVPFTEVNDVGATPRQQGLETKPEDRRLDPERLPTQSAANYGRQGSVSSDGRSHGLTWTRASARLREFDVD